MISLEIRVQDSGCNCGEGGCNCGEKNKEISQPAPVDKLKTATNVEKAETAPVAKTETTVDTVQEVLGDMMGDAPACDECGHITVRNGSCYKCLNCGNSLGCS